MQVCDSYDLPLSSTPHPSQLPSPAHSHPSPRHAGQEELGLLVQHPEIKISAASAIS